MINHKRLIPLWIRQFIPSSERGKYLFSYKNKKALAWWWRVCIWWWWKTIHNWLSKPWRCMEWSIKFLGMMQNHRWSHQRVQKISDDVNKIVEWNLLLDMLNSTKHAKNKCSHLYQILNGYMNNRRGKVRFKNFQILLHSGSSSTIIMVRMISKLKRKKMLICNGKQNLGSLRLIRNSSWTSAYQNSVQNYLCFNVTLITPIKVGTILS